LSFERNAPLFSDTPVTIFWNGKKSYNFRLVSLRRTSLYSQFSFFTTHHQKHLKIGFDNGQDWIISVDKCETSKEHEDCCLLGCCTV
jgi:hypothetical protein